MVAWEICLLTEVQGQKTSFGKYFSVHLAFLDRTAPAGGATPTPPRYALETVLSKMPLSGFLQLDHNIYDQHKEGMC